MTPHLIDADSAEFEAPACDAVVDPTHATPLALLAAAVGAQLGLVQVHFWPPLHVVLVLVVFGWDGVFILVDQHVVQDVGDDAELVLLDVRNSLFQISTYVYTYYVLLVQQESDIVTTDHLTTSLILILFGSQLLERVLLGPVEEELPLLDDPCGVGLCGDADGAAAVGVEGPGAVGGLAPVVHREERPVVETLAGLVPECN